MISGSAETPIRFEGMSPKDRVFARPDRRSSPKESVTKEVAKRRRRAASEGADGWWFVVRGMAAPSETRERRMRVSPQWAVMRVEGEEGCQKGVGVGVDIRATEQVEPPRKGLLVFGDGGWGDAMYGDKEWGDMSAVLMGRSAAMGSESDFRRRSWVVRNDRSAFRKAWVRIVKIVGLGESEEDEGRAVNAGGEKRRK